MGEIPEHVMIDGDKYFYRDAQECEAWAECTEVVYNALKLSPHLWETRKYRSSKALSSQPQKGE